MSTARKSAPVIGLCMTLLLVACTDDSGGSTNKSASATSPPANSATVEQAAGSAAATTGSSHPLCNKASFAEVSAVTGGHFDKIDVIDEPDLDYIDCVFLDSRDLYAGLTIRFVSTAKLVATASKWSTAAAYFDEWGRTGKPVAGIGDRAAWIELPAGLLVLAGDQAVQFSASKTDLSDPAVRARFETLARALVAKLP